MSAEPLLSKSDDWTLADLARLPHDGRRYEIVDGSLVMGPAPGNRHQLLVGALTVLLAASAPRGLVVLPGGNVTMQRTVRIPDVLVVPARLASGDLLATPADAVVLAVEVLSPGSQTTDLVTKPAEYAAAGIEHYWRVDPDGPSLTAFRREGTRYREVGRWYGDQEAQLSEPFPVRLVPAELLR